MATAAPVRRLGRPQPATVIVALVVVLGTAVLFWAGNGLARVGAGALLARAVQQATGVDERPAVRLRGPVLSGQLVRGRYDEVRVEMPAVTAGPVRLTRLRADLHGVRLPFHDVLVQDSHHVAIDRATQDAVMTWDDLDRYLRLTGRGLRSAPAGAGLVRLTGSVPLVGRTVRASGEARFVPGGDGIAVRPVRLSLAPGHDSASLVLLRQRFTLQIPMQVLPFGQQVTSVTVEDEGLHVHASGAMVSLQD